jgi:hypothetical protein
MSKRTFLVTALAVFLAVPLAHAAEPRCPTVGPQLVNPDFADETRDGRIVLGMSKRVVSETWGEPHEVSRHRFADHVEEQWRWNKGVTRYSASFRGDTLCDFFILRAQPAPADYYRAGPEK